MTPWISGTLELSSKVRYGLTSRGVPLFRFVPYDKNLSPFAVGCQSRDLFYNVHAIVEPLDEDNQSSSGMKRANLIQNFGPITNYSELQVLLYTYAYNNTKELRKYNENATFIIPSLIGRETMPENSFTFHIDPEGCKDVDDAITLFKLGENKYKVWIHIADVSEWISEDSKIDKEAYYRSISFYSLYGKAICPMFHSSISENAASLLPNGSPKPAVSLSFLWDKKEGVSDFKWSLTSIECTHSYSYENAIELKELQAICVDLGAIEKDTHSWIEKLMIIYNTHAGLLLKKSSIGILRRQHGKSADRYKLFSPFLCKYPELEILANQSAEYCLASDSNTQHQGISTSTYAYVSSPLRRYVDLINQRILKKLLFGYTTNKIPDEASVAYMNYRQKQAKAFYRDLFFSTCISSITDTSVKGIVLSDLNSKSKYSVYIPKWKSVIKIYTISECPPIGEEITIAWFVDNTQPNWKHKIVFSVLK